MPKGTLDGNMLPGDSSVGDELKVEIEQELDGMRVISVIRGREKSGMDLLELLPVEENFQAVIETRAKRDRNDRDDRGGRGGRDGRDGRGARRDGGRGGRDGGRGRDGESREPRGDSRGPRRPHFDPPPEVPQRPKPKRLRPGKARRNEVLAAIPEEQRPVAELAVQGMAAVRTRLAEDNKRLAADGKPTMPEDSVLKLAESLIPKLRVADWLDRAEATQRQMENLDLRDLRSVVAASDDPIVARDESTRELATKLKADLVVKQEQELKLWLDDVDAALTVGRSIRALRLSSQPPKAGVMFPPELARKLSDAATAGLTVEDSADRWSAVMEAAAFSPVRTLVNPTAPPSTITDDLRKTALRLGPLLPQIAALLGVEVPADAPRPKPLRPGPRNDNKREKPASRDGGGRDGAGRERGERGGAGRDGGRSGGGRDGRARAGVTTNDSGPADAALGEQPAQSDDPAKNPTTEPDATPTVNTEPAAVVDTTTAHDDATVIADAPGSEQPDAESAAPAPAVEAASIVEAPQPDDAVVADATPSSDGDDSSAPAPGA